MIYKEITVSRAHQFNDPHESFANHRVCVSATVELEHRDSAQLVIKTLMTNLDGELRKEREHVENRSLASRMLDAIEEAIAKCKSHEGEETWACDLELLEDLKCATQQAFDAGSTPPEIDNAKFMKVSLFLPF